MTERVRVCVPPLPHVMLHEPHVDHWLITQSMAQVGNWQSWFSVRAAHGLPPNAGVRVMPRERVRVAAAPDSGLHVALQLPHAPHSPTSQSTGHEKPLQDRASSRCAHAPPPNCGSCSTLRVRVCEPVPHVLLHAVQCDQLESLQGTAHLNVLHSFWANSGGHALPPWSTSTTMGRVRRCTPPPHGSVHSFHAPHCPTTQSWGHICVLHGFSSFK